MSHFVGLVVLTPGYLEKHDLEMSLEKYNENREVEEYSNGPVSDYEKLEFIEYYKRKDGTISPEHDHKDLWQILYDRLREEGKVEEFDQEKHRTVYLLLNDTLGEDGFQKAYVELFNELYPTLFGKFDTMYEEKGEDWNSNSWRFNYVTSQWEKYSTYNPDSKWDWYTEGGRWDGCLKNKDGEHVNECLLSQLDLSSPTPKEDEKYYIGEHSAPFCLVIDGEWFEKGEMGWFGISTNDKPQDDWNTEFMNIINKLPGNSEVHLIDFHI